MTTYTVSFGDEKEPFARGTTVEFDPAGRALDVIGRDDNGEPVSLVGGPLRVDELPGNNLAWYALWPENPQRSWYIVVYLLGPLRTRGTLLGMLTPEVNGEPGIVQRTGVWGAEAVDGN